MSAVCGLRPGIKGRSGHGVGSENVDGTNRRVCSEEVLVRMSRGKDAVGDLSNNYDCRF